MQCPKLIIRQLVKLVICYSLQVFDPPSLAPYPQLVVTSMWVLITKLRCINSLCVPILVLLTGSRTIWCIYILLVHSHIVHLWLYILLIGAHILENSQELSCSLGVEIEPIRDMQLGVHLLETWDWNNTHQTDAIKIAPTRQMLSRSHLMQLEWLLTDRCDWNCTYKTDAIKIAPASTNKHTYKTRTITRTSKYF